MLKTFEEFVEYYNKRGICIGQMSRPKHKLNQKELHTRYDKYVKNNQPEEYEVDEKWTEVVDIISKRDYNTCRLIPLLTKEELAELYKNPITLIKILDPAHVFARSQSKELYYDPDNIVLLNRVSHSFIDQYRNPVTGKPITKEERIQWWKKIIGNEAYDNLERKYKGEI